MAKKKNAMDEFLKASKKESQKLHKENPEKYHAPEVAEKRLKSLLDVCMGIKL